MKTSTTPFPSALCEASYISYMREEGDANGYVTPAVSGCLKARKSDD